jgi:hypothetical protein
MGCSAIKEEKENEEACMVVDIVTRLRAGRPRNPDSIPGRCNILFCSLYEGREAGHSPPSSVDVKSGEAALHSAKYSWRVNN